MRVRSALLVLTIGCASQKAPTVVRPIDAKPAVAPAETTAKEVPPALELLARSVDSLPAGLDDDPGEAAATTLDALAAALADGDGAALPRSHSVTAREMIDQLRAALSTIGDRIDTAPDRRSHAAFAQAGVALGRLSPATSLSAQRAETLEAFRAITAAFAAAVDVELEGHPVRFESLERNTGAARESIVKADEAVADAATATDWKSVRVAMAKSLDFFADFLATTPVAGGTTSAAIDAAAIVIRYDAARLRHAAAIDFGKTDWVRHALTTTVDAVETIAPELGTSPPMLARARRSSLAITSTRSFVFQRAAIQDALRAVSDMLLAARAPSSSERVTREDR